MKIKKNTIKDAPKAVKTVGFMILATVLSKVLGMLRGVLLASNYGIGAEANAFSAASRIPLAFFDMLFSAAILGCFIPVYNSFSKDSKDTADDFACVFFNVILLLTGIISIIGIIFAPLIISLIAPGLNTETSNMAIYLLRIMFPMIIFTGTAYTLVGVLQSKEKYLLPALISSISNAGVIIYFLLLNDKFGTNGIYGLAFAYLVAWFIQLITLIIPLIKGGFKYKTLIDLKNPALIRALKMAPPIMIGSWLAPIGVMSGTFFATFIKVEGAVTIFDYANNMYIIIVGTLTYSICNFVFPVLSRMSVHGEEEEFNKTVRTGLTSLMFIILPFMFSVFILSGEGVSILYMRNEFDGAAAILTSDTLKWLTIAMPSFAIIEVLSRVFYAKNLVKIPMVAALCGVTINVVSSIILTKFEILGVSAVSLANALGQIAAAIILLIFLKIKIKGIYNKEFILKFIKILLCSILSFVVMTIVYKFIGNIPYENVLYKNLIVAGGVFIVGAGIYLLAAKILKILK